MLGSLLDHFPRQPVSVVTPCGARPKPEVLGADRIKPKHSPSPPHVESPKVGVRTPPAQGLMRTTIFMCAPVSVPTHHPDKTYTVERMQGQKVQRERIERKRRSFQRTHEAPPYRRGTTPLTSSVGGGLYRPGVYSRRRFLGLGCIASAGSSATVPAFQLRGAPATAYIPHHGCQDTKEAPRGPIKLRVKGIRKQMKANGGVPLYLFSTVMGIQTVPRFANGQQGSQGQNPYF